MTLSAGARLGPYEVLAVLGSGGMGEVYRARDGRLGRDVALKVLPPSFAKDEERLHRFEREARAAGALNHPNVLSVYDVGRDDGNPYLVSELLDGETLRAVLAGARLPLRKALDYGVQLARGLAAAHEKGIVHRDLKPENVFVCRDGRLKVLDFGLARIVRPEGGPSGADDSTTTAAGAPLGTAGYMSPEQVQERPTDARSDVFALGAVLYELLTGQRAFHRATAIETMGAILKEDPPEISPSNPGVPPAVERIVRRCLEKRPEERFHSAHDVALALEAMSGTSGTGAGASTGEPRVGRRLAGLTLAVLAAAAVVAVVAALRIAETSVPSPQPSYQRLTFRRGNVRSARFTPDGQTVVYGASWQGGPFRLFSTRPGAPDASALSLPDGTILAISPTAELAMLLDARGVNPAGTLARAQLDGGAPREVLEKVYGAAWSPDGKELAVIRQVGPHVRLEYPIGHVLAEGGADLTWPRISARGDLAYVEHDVHGSMIWTIDRTGAKKLLTTGRTITGIAWSATGDEAWFTAGDRFQSQTLQAVSLSGQKRVVATFPVPTSVEDIHRDGNVLLRLWTYEKTIHARLPADSQERDLSWLEASRAGDLSEDGRLLLFHESGEGGGRGGRSYLRRTDGSSAPVPLGDGFGVALSPDAKSALTFRPDSPSQLFVVPTGPGEPRVLNGGSVVYMNEGRWFPDGRRILIRGYEGEGADRSYVQPLDGPPRAITPEGVVAAAVSPDGRFAAALDLRRSLVLYPVDGGEPRPAAGPPEPGRLGQFGPDGRWIYVTEFDGRVARIFRRDVANGARHLWKSLTLADPAGVFLVETILTPDGSAYVYTVHRAISSLYLVSGLR